MTEDEWFRAPDPQVLLESSGSRLSARKLRLFAVACCQTIANLLTTSQREALNTAELFADGRATVVQVKDALVHALNQTATGGQAGQNNPIHAHTMRCLHTALYARDHESLYISDEWFGGTGILVQYMPEAFKRPFDYALYTSINVAQTCAAYAGIDDSTKAQEKILQHVFQDHARLLKDIVGNPFSDGIQRLIEHVDTDLKLFAAWIYVTGAFDRVSQLATMMRDRGLAHPAIDEQASSDSPHVRGTWLVDSVLGFE